jgi:hypothetical protein
VLVLGAGTGNDVAGALRAGAQHIDAVEIDPQILALGKRFHPEHPYDSPRVVAYLTDARSYLRNTRQTYDLILFAFLDSTTLLSGLSSIRLDNYVYTVESFADARRRLCRLPPVPALPPIASRPRCKLRLMSLQPPTSQTTECRVFCWWKGRAELWI